MANWNDEQFCRECGSPLRIRTRKVGHNPRTGRKIVEHYWACPRVLLLYNHDSFEYPHYSATPYSAGHSAFYIETD